MRVDIVSIFPDYLAPLELSLPGKAQQSGLLDLRVHDLRQWATGRHRSVDDTPYGGGAGMVMSPEPWGEALDALELTATTTVVVPTPAGEPLTQALAQELSSRDRLVIACGRYEGIDQRVVEYAASRAEVREISLGDYVLNGGEVAALALVEAVIRLLPGFMGNAESIAEESHSDGLLEAPVYTKPPVWRGLAVPDVLLSGDHGRIAAWRREQSVDRTVARRPDLAARALAVTLPELVDSLRPATPADVPELQVLSLACWLPEAILNEDWQLPPITESLEDRRAGLELYHTWVVHAGARLVGSVRGRLTDDGWEVGRLMVAPDLQGKGLGRWLLSFVESQAPAAATAYWLLTGQRSERNLALYRKAGYRILGEGPQGTFRLGKTRR